MRHFDSGATRDSDDTKPDYVGFESALVTKRFGEYMLLHQRQADGSLRSSSNWRKGIPVEVYNSSLARHVETVKLHLEGFEAATQEGLEDALCGVLFNAQGMLYEVLKAQWQPRLLVVSQRDEQGERR